MISPRGAAPLMKTVKSFIKMDLLAHYEDFYSLQGIKKLCSDHMHG